jgi:uncharacterized coiled-coil protein SlyX
MAKSIQKDHAYDVKKAVSKPESTCGHEPLLKSLEQRLAALEKRLDRSERQVALLTKKLKAAEAENARLQKRVIDDRDFLKIYEGMPKNKIWAKSWLLVIAKLFVLHHKKFKLFMAGRTFGEEWLTASNDIETHVKDLHCKWTTELEKYRNKEQRTALQSLRRHWLGLTLFLSDIRIPLVGL